MRLITKRTLSCTQIKIIGYEVEETMSTVVKEI